ncbi:YicC/YloC family endoribonuclease [Scopulibacillus cellulosilyticus]|uniref:YicC/YloC family endoribonuclease n=1 Tax=Scopulibacillus cellulosilyticus TaxID=2665665 RepID=A0ABW2PW33_9BACL
MFLSMTGFGRAFNDTGRHRISVEIKSVNHRYLDISLNIPRQLLYLEDKIKQIIKKSVKRGKVYLYLTIDGEPLSTQKVDINWPIVEQYITAFHQLQEHYSIKDNIQLSHLLACQDVFAADETTIDLDDVEDDILQTVEQSVEGLYAMRRQEGENIEQDLSERLKILDKKIEELTAEAPHVKEQYKQRLEKHVKEFLEGHAEIDEQKLYNEVAVFSDKSNIDEELTRLVSHINQFTAFMAQTEPIGRKLDFLIQEMNREINTIGSKGNDAAISRYVVDIKSEIEKIREQIQNIE